MKKLIVIFVMLAYGLSATGSTVHIHFCCGKIDAVKLVPVTGDQCPVGHKDKKPGCCDDKQLELKIKSDHKSETQTKFRLDSPIVEALSIDAWRLLTMETDPVVHRNPASPPGTAAVSLFKLNCIYRI